MPVDLSVKKVPDALAQHLRERARRNHRSLQGELLAILEAAIEAGPSVSLDPVRIESAAPPLPILDVV